MTTKTVKLDKGQIEVVDDRVAEILRTKSGPERLNMVWADWSFFQMRITAYLKHEHPDWTEEQIRKEIFRRVTFGTAEEFKGSELPPMGSI